MRLYCGLEHIQAERAVAERLHFFAGRVDRCRHILHERHHIAEEFHHAAHAHILQRAHAEHREDRTIDQPFPDAKTHFVFGKMFLFEEFLHQRLIVFGCSLDKLTVQFLSPLTLLGRYLLYDRHAPVGSPGIFFHKQDVDHGVEARADTQGILYGHHFFAEDVAHLLDDRVIFGFFAVELIEREDHRFVELGTSAEDILSTHFHSILGIDEYQTGIGDIESRDSIAYKVIGTRTVYYIQFLAKEFGIEDA